jgi:hypothetical protein
MGVAKVVIPLLSYGALSAWAVKSGASLSEIFLSTSYPIEILIFVVFLERMLQFLRKRGFSLKGFVVKNRLAILLSACSVAIVFSSVPVGLKTLSDETNLISTSQSMLTHQRVDLVTDGTYYYGNFNAIGKEIPKRPLLFPFLLSIVHSVRGYDYRNAFVLNAILFFLMLMALAISAERLAGKTYAILLLLLVLAQPILSISATSAGFDLLATVSLLFSLIATQVFLEDETPETAGLLSMSLVLLIHTRYESALYAALFVAFLFIKKKVGKKFFRENYYPLVFLPVFLLPIVLQRILTRNNLENPPGVAPFSFEHFSANFLSFLQIQFHFDGDLPYAHLLILLLPLSLGFIVISAYRKMKETSHLIELGLLALAIICLNYVVIFSYYFGYYGHPASTRFFLNLAVFSSISAATALYLARNHLKPIAAVAFSAGIFIFYHPVAMESRNPNTVLLSRETDLCIHFLKSIDASQAIIVSSRPGQYTAMGYSSVGFDYLRDHLPSVTEELSKGLHTSLYVLQEKNYRDQKPVENSRLDPSIQVEEVEKHMITGEFYLSIGKVTGFSNAPVPAEAPRIPASIKKSP